MVSNMRLAERIERLERIETNVRSGITAIELVNPLTGEVEGVLPVGRTERDSDEVD